MAGLFEAGDVRRLLELVGRHNPELARVARLAGKMLPRTMGVVTVGVEELAAGVASELAAETLGRLAEAGQQLDAGLAEALAAALEERPAPPRKRPAKRSKLAAAPLPPGKFKGTIVVRPDPPAAAAPRALPPPRKR